MRSKKTLLGLLAALLIAVLVAACAAPVAPAAAPAAGEATAPAEEAPAAEAPAAEGDLPYIAIISKGFQHQFWQAVEQGAEQAAEELGATISYEGPESETQVDRQLEMFQAALSRNPAAVCLAALDTQALLPLLEQTQASGIPVVAFDSGVDSDIPVTTATTDNIAAAALAADKMAELIGGSGEVAVVVHDQVSRTGIDRRDGFVNRIAEAYPDITVVDVQYGEGDHLKSADITKAIIAAHPDLKGIFGANEGSAVGVVLGVTELGTEGLVIIGYDAGAAQKDAIRSGVMAGAISQNPVGIGYKCVEAALGALAGEELPEVIDTGFVWYDATNIDDPELAPLLYD